MNMDKKTDTMALLKRSRQAKQKAKSKMLVKKLGRKKNDATFHKVNFNG